jgi:hypothetical protein
MTDLVLGWRTKAQVRARESENVVVWRMHTSSNDVQRKDSKSKVSRHIYSNSDSILQPTVSFDVFHLTQSTVPAVAGISRVIRWAAILLALFNPFISICAGVSAWHGHGQLTASCPHSSVSFISKYPFLSYKLTMSKCYWSGVEPKGKYSKPLNILWQVPQTETRAGAHEWGSASAGGRM